MNKALSAFIIGSSLLLSSCGGEEVENPLALQISEITPILGGESVPCEEFRTTGGEGEEVISSYRTFFNKATVTWDPGEDNRSLNILGLRAELIHTSLGSEAARAELSEEYLNVAFGLTAGNLGTQTEVTSIPSCSIQFGGLSLTLDDDTPSFTANMRIILTGISADPDGGNPKMERAEAQAQAVWESF